MFPKINYGMHTLLKIRFQVNIGHLPLYINQLEMLGQLILKVVRQEMQVNHIPIDFVVYERVTKKYFLHY